MRKVYVKPAAIQRSHAFEGGDSRKRFALPAAGGLGGFPVKYPRRHFCLTAKWHMALR